MVPSSALAAGIVLYIVKFRVLR